jgi:uncharacterized phiE125 gp8 family phage protein
MYHKSRVKRSVVITPPVVEPIDRDDIAKLDLKLDESDIEDDLLDIWIQAAREGIEEKTGRSLITQGRRIKLDYFPVCNSIELTHGPVQADSIVVKYFDENDAEQTLASSEYWVDTDSIIARIVIKNYWPAIKCRPNAVSIDYDAGYGDAATDVPKALVSACLMRLAHLYENRQSVVIGSIATDVPLGEDDLIGPYIVVQDAFY